MGPKMGNPLDGPPDGPEGEAGPQWAVFGGATPIKTRKNTLKMAFGSNSIHFATPPAGSPTVAHAMKAPPCAAYARIRSSELTMYYLDCSDFATLPPPQPFPSPPLPIDAKVLRPTHRCSSQSSPRSAALPIAALPGPVASALHRSQGPRPSLPQQRSATLPIAAALSRRQGLPPSPSL